MATMSNAKLVIPPPEIKAIADKTAAFVAKNGVSFEERIKDNEKGNQKFWFLNQGDPYRAYYDWKVNYFKENPYEVPKDVTSKREIKKRQKKQFEPPAEPPALDFIANPPQILAQDLDVIKLTALFVAKNGKSFMSSLSERESKNYRFDFLRPNHSVFNFFTKLVEQYSKTISGSQNLIDSLEIDSKDRYTILDRVMKRVDYTVYYNTQKKKETDEAEADNLAFALIDWHDFVIVDTIDFIPDDLNTEFPSPLYLADLERIVFSGNDEELELSDDETVLKKVKTN